MNFPTYTEYKYENYSFELQDEINWKKYLETHGFVVLKNIVPKEVCESFRNGLWKTINSLTEVDLNDGKNKSRATNYPLSLHGGMYNIGHTKTQWAARYRCKKVFEKIWDEKDLITSFDKFAYLPKERTYRQPILSSWIHSDQSPLNKIVSYQGLLCLTDNDKFKSGGFICIPKTNTQHKEICEGNGDGKTKTDWIKLSDEFKEKNVKDENILKVRNKIGDFVIWDSKTIHSGMAPINEKEERYDRVAIYICMRKRSDANKKIINKRKKAFKEKRNTTHNPAHCKLFEKNLGRFSGTTYEGIMETLNKNNLLVDDNMLDLV